MVCGDMVLVLVPYDGMKVDVGMEVVGMQQQDDADEIVGWLMEI